MNNNIALKVLEALLGSEKLLTDKVSLENYGKDWTKLYTPNPLAIVFPKTIEEVQAIVHWANQYLIALVPSGGRTGLSGGAVATNQEVVICFDYMNKIINFNIIDREITCQAGIVTKQLQNIAEEKGFYYPVDFASSGSSQIGGNIATNAGGIKVIRYGMTRNWIAGLKVVTGKGDILELNKGLTKNATGYDFRNLFIGSEGTLGFIVEATIKLERKPKDLTVMVLGVLDFESLMLVLSAFQTRLELTAFEFFSDKCLAKILDRGDIPAPFNERYPFYALIEFEAPVEHTKDQAMEVFEYCLEQGWVVDGVVSQSEQQLQNLWRLREDISETIAPFTPYKNDLSVTISKVAAFLADIDMVVKVDYPDFEVLWYGHIGDGNLHLNILKPTQLTEEDFFAKCAEVNTKIFKVVQKYNGSISAEHGVGLVKRDYLQYTRSATEIEYMRAVKAVFDPNRIMNPGKIFN